MNSHDELRGAAEDGVKRALSRGADAAEVYVARASTLAVAADSSGAQPSVGLEDGVAVRVVVGGRMGFSGAPSRRSLDDAIAHALASARQPSASKAAAFPAAPAPGAGAGAARLDDAMPADALDGAAGIVTRAVATAQAARHVTYIEARYRRAVIDFGVANSAGTVAADRVENERIEMELRVTRGTTARSSADVFVASRALASMDVDGAVAALAARATEALDASPLVGSAEQVILHPAPASQVVGIAARAFSGIAARSRQSVLSGRVGEAVMSPLVSITDEPRSADGARSRRFDDEGMPVRSHVLVEGGILRGFLYDAQTALLAGETPTGHGLRKGVTGGVAPRPINLAVAPGDASMEELVEQCERGILVTEPLLGSFTSNQVTGDFSVVVPFAFLVEAGRIRHALPPTSIGGNAHRVLAEVRGLTRERRTLKPGRLPGILAGGISCAT